MQAGDRKQEIYNWWPKHNLIFSVWPIVDSEGIIRNRIAANMTEVLELEVHKLKYIALFILLEYFNYETVASVCYSNMIHVLTGDRM